MPARMETRQVLVIDDDAHLLALIQMNLELEGFRVLTAETGAEGLELANSCIPDLILLDVMMEGLNGLQVLSRLRQNERTAQIRIMMLTAQRQISQIDRALSIGADDYITKPFDPEGLAAILRRKLASANGAA